MITALKKALKTIDTANPTNPASNSLLGTFTFTAHDQDNATATITVTGSFSGSPL